MVAAVCLVQPTLFPEASRIDIHEYARALAQLGVETHVIVSQDRSTPRANLTVHATGFPPRNDPLSWLRFARFAEDRVLQLAQERKLGLVHLFNPSPATWLLGRRLARRAARPALVYDLRTGGLGHGPAAWLTDATARSAPGFADGLIALTQGVGRRVFPANAAFVVVPLGVDLEAFRPAPSPDAAEYVFIYAGTLSPNRELSRMIEAFERVARRHAHARLRIAGDGGDRSRLESLVASHGLQRAVTFLNKREPREIPALLAGAHCGLSYVPKTPWFEPQPQLKTLECFAMDLPVVAVHTAGNADCWDSLPRELLTADDAEAFARGMCFALERGNALRTGAFRAAAERHGWLQIARERLLPLYARLMASPPPGDARRS